MDDSVDHATDDPPLSAVGLERERCLIGIGDDRCHHVPEGEQLRG
jgi:hypothetical protein